MTCLARVQNLVAHVGDDDKMRWRGNSTRLALFEHTATSEESPPEAQPQATWNSQGRW